MGNALVQSAIIQLKDRGAPPWGSVALPPSSWVDNVGLLWPSGVEPVDSGLYPLASGKRIWYVDLDSAVDGDGSELSPVNHFTDLVGWFDGSNYHQGTLGFVGGDQIWIKGTATPAKHANGVTNMNIYMKRDAQFGTSAEPTVIRSWPGQPRALFDGEYTESLGIVAEGVFEVGNAVVVLNIAGTRCTSPPVFIDDAVAWSRVVSCYAYFNYAITPGPSGTYGGLAVNASSGLRDHEIHNCLTHDNNTTDGSTVYISNNIGGLSLLTEDTVDPLSTVKFYLNECYNESNAIRHKHEGGGIFESYNNILHDSEVGHYIRNENENNIHHNIVYDCNSEAVLESENSTASKSISYYNNTVSRCGLFVRTNGNIQTYQDTVSISKNIYFNSANVSSLINLGGTGDGYSLVGVSSDNNMFVTGDEAVFWQNNGAPNRTLSDWNATIPDSTSITDDPLFVDAVNNNYTLQAGSPAINLNGNRVGAL